MPPSPPSQAQGQDQGRNGTRVKARGGEGGEGGGAGVESAPRISKRARMPAEAASSAGGLARGAEAGGLAPHDDGAEVIYVEHLYMYMYM